MNRVKELIDHYELIAHQEGGYFKEIYTSDSSYNNREYCGNIYYLLDKDEISHFHVLDCQEAWFFHEGCGMKITVISDNKIKHLYLGNDINNNQSPFVLLEKGEIFAAENIDKSSYTFVSCITVPKFTYEGYRLVNKDEIRQYTDDPDIISLAYD